MSNKDVTNLESLYESINQNKLDALKSFAEKGAPADIFFPDGSIDVDAVKSILSKYTEIRSDYVESFVEQILWNMEDSQLENLTELRLYGFYQQFLEGIYDIEDDEGYGRGYDSDHEMEDRRDGI